MKKDERFSHRFLVRHRKPRVRLRYGVEVYGAEKEVVLPFVAGILGDFAGWNPSRKPFRERKFTEVDVDNFAVFMADVRPRVNVNTGDEEHVILDFESLSDFTPQGLISRVPILSRLWELRQSLLASQRDDPDSVARLLSESGHSSVVLQADEVSVEVAREAVESRISQLLHVILQNPDFRSLESSWRGLWYLIVQTETSEDLKIRVLDVSKRELEKDLRKSPSVNQSNIFKKVYDEEFGIFGGEPFGVLIGDYSFSHARPDMEMLSNISHMAAAANAPFVAAASATMFGMEDLVQLQRVRSIAKIFESPEYSAWKAFRDSEDARWVVLTVPQMLMRAPYHYQSEGATAYLFSEVVEEESALLWGNAAFGLAACMTRAYAEESWVSNIEGAEEGGRVMNLALASVRSQDGNRVKRCTTFAVSDRREMELSDAGFAALCQAPDAGEAVFFSIPSCQRPRSYESVEATGNARILSQIPTVMVCGRFAHYLKAIARDWIGVFKERGDYERKLNEWLSGYVSGEPVVSDEDRARCPLREARVEVSEMSGAPGRLLAMVYMRPQYGMKGLDVSLRFPVLLPTAMNV